MTTTTTAEQVAEQLGDGQTWAAADGRTFDDLVEDASVESRDVVGSVPARYVFADGSVIADYGGHWDLGFAACWCQASTGHVVGCEAGLAPRGTPHWVTVTADNFATSVPVLSRLGLGVLVVDIALALGVPIPGDTSGRRPGAPPPEALATSVEIRAGETGRGLDSRWRWLVEYVGEGSRGAAVTLTGEVHEGVWELWAGSGRVLVLGSDPHYTVLRVS